MRPLAPLDDKEAWRAASDAINILALQVTNMALRAGIILSLTMVVVYGCTKKARPFADNGIFGGWTLSQKDSGHSSRVFVNLNFRNQYIKYKDPISHEEFSPWENRVIWVPVSVTKGDNDLAYEPASKRWYRPYLSDGLSKWWNKSKTDPMTRVIFKNTDEVLLSNGSNRARRDTVVNIHQRVKKFVFYKLPRDARGHIQAGGMNLQFGDFEDLDARSGNFSGANLEGASFARSNLGKANLASASGEHVDFSTAILDGANFSEANLPWNIMRGASGTGTNFANAILAYGNWQKITLQNPNLNKTDLQIVDARDATFVDVRGNGIITQGGDFRRARLPKDFWCHTTGTSFETIHLPPTSDF